MNPPPLTTTEQIIDPIFYYIIGISFFFLLLITAIMLWFVWKYRRSRHPRPTSQVTKNVPLEILWTLIPTIIALSMFYYGWSGYIALQRPPQGSMKVNVTARQWSWSFEYPNGKTSSKLYVPTGKPVEVDLRTLDVIHSFFIPAFRVKRDVVPGRITHAWFIATDPGSYDLFCAEYCGAGHSAMITTVEALPPEKFTAWYEKEEAEGEAAEFKALLTRYGCTGCHSLDGSASVGPTFKGLFGNQVTVVTNGTERTITADREYIRRSILEPQADIVKGFPPVMPSFQGKIPASDLKDILDHFEEMGTGGEAKEAKLSGKELVQKKGCIGCHSTDGSQRVGPTFKGLFGSQVTVEEGGKTETVTADEDYLKESIRHPKAEIVKGFPPVMPDFPDLKDEEIEAIVEYIKGLK